jgi:Anti-sigma factor NepR
MGKRGEQRPPKVPAAKRDAASHGGGESGTPFPVHEHVGRRLKEMFDEVTVQPIPEKFVKLLEELEQRQLDGARSGQTVPEAAKPPLSKGKPRKSK